MSGLRAVGVALAAVLLAGCATHHPSAATSPTTTTATAAALPVGPGPQKVYTVQRQPPAGACHTRGDGVYPLPDPVCTPGAVSPAVTPATVKTTVCVPGYSGRVRPPQTITGPEKTANAKSYGGHQNLRTAEYDHLVPISIGGDPNDPRNLWVQPNDNPAATSTHNHKDDIEYAAYLALCSGKVDLRTVQVGMATDWPALAKQPAIAYELAHGGHPTSAGG